MGREIKRVAGGFSWPLGKVWEGFICPHHPQKCAACNGSGSSPEAKRFSDEWYGKTTFDPRSTGSKPFGPNHPAVREFATRNVGHSPSYYGTDRDAIRREAERLAFDCFDNHWSHHLSQADVDALVEGGRLHDFTHEWKGKDGWQPRDPPVHPTAEQVNLWSLQGFSHDSINNWICVKARCKREGVPDTCSVCKGSGIDPTDAATAKLMDEWKSTEPPTGTAYQIWETVSEGSPVTPAFDKTEDLANWCVVHQFDDAEVQSDGERWNGIAGGTTALTKEQWLSWINGSGWAPSMVDNGDGLRSGVEAMVET